MTRKPFQFSVFHLNQAQQARWSLLRSLVAVFPPALRDLVASVQVTHHVRVPERSRVEFSLEESWRWRLNRSAPPPPPRHTHTSHPRAISHMFPAHRPSLHHVVITATTGGRRSETAAGCHARGSEVKAAGRLHQNFRRKIGGGLTSGRD